MSMSWTERVVELRLRWVWARKISPAARRMRSRGVSFLDASDDASDDSSDDSSDNSSDNSSDDSWYVRVDPDEPQFVEIESSDIGGALHEMWSAQGLHELAAISDNIASLAATLGTEDASKSDLSTEAYAMY
jgi:hypothetical protein